MPAILLDTCVWYSLFDSRDPYHFRSLELEKQFSCFNIALPWPIAYETLRTRFVGNKLALSAYKQYLSRHDIEFLDDKDLREASFDLCIDSSLLRNRPLSMDDCLIRLMIDDVDFRINYLATFNVGDFADICRKRKVEILC
jgi:predicted nucleic acid-binding protein